MGRMYRMQMEHKKSVSFTKKLVFMGDIKVGWPAVACRVLGFVVGQFTVLQYLRSES